MKSVHFLVVMIVNLPCCTPIPSSTIIALRFFSLAFSYNNHDTDDLDTLTTMVAFADAAGEYSQSFTVTAVRDSVAFEGMECFTIDLQLGTGCSMADDNIVVETTEVCIFDLTGKYALLECDLALVNWVTNKSCPTSVSFYIKEAHMR